MAEDIASKTAIGEFVRHQRELRAWSQEQLAEIANVSCRTIQRLEAGKSAGHKSLRAVAQAFKLDVKVLQLAGGSMESGSTRKYIHLLPRLSVGTDVTAIVLGTEQFQIEHDDDDDPRSIAAMKDVLNEFKGDVVRVYDADPSERLKIEEELSCEIKNLEGVGYYFFGIKRVIPKFVDGQTKLVSVATVFMSHSRSRKIVRDNDMMVIPALLTEVAT